MGREVRDVVERQIREKISGYRGLPGVAVSYQQPVLGLS